MRTPLAILLALFLMLSINTLVYAAGGEDENEASVQLETEIVSSSYQPDNSIEGDGNNIYNSDGTSQTASRTLANSSTAIYIIGLQNDGVVPDIFNVSGTEGAGNWNITYFDGASGGNDITSSVTGVSGWITPLINIGDSITIRLEVAPSGLPGGSQNTVFLTATSHSDSSKQDTVRAISTVSAQVTGGGGGGGQDITGQQTSGRCPLTLTVNVLGEIGTASMTSDGVLCEGLSVGDQVKWEADTDIKLTCAGNKVPELIKLEVAQPLITPDNTAVIGQMYALNAYPSINDSKSSSISISPPARLILPYNPYMVSENASQITTAYFDETANQWVELEIAGQVASDEGTQTHLTTHINHFTVFAVLARLSPEIPAKSPDKPEQFSRSENSEETPSRINWWYLIGVVIIILAVLSILFIRARQVKSN